jgi:hypothetical protein
LFVDIWLTLSNFPWSKHFLGRHHELVVRCEISIYQMANLIKIILEKGYEFNQDIFKYFENMQKQDKLLI